MYTPGAYVVKVNEGICQIEEIVELKDPGTAGTKEYYLLFPLENPAVKIYVPVENGDKRIRPVMTEAAARALIDRIDAIAATEVADERRREQQYREAVHSGDPEQLVAMIKETWQRNHRRNQQGKKNTAVDTHFLQMAEDRLYAELAFALGTDRNGVCELIEAQAGQKET